MQSQMMTHTSSAIRDKTIYYLIYLSCIFISEGNEEEVEKGDGDKDTEATTQDAAGKLSILSATE